MGEVSRPIVINRTDKVPLDKLIGTIIIERIFDFMTPRCSDIAGRCSSVQTHQRQHLSCLVLQSDKFKVYSA
jgi:hypothetical protein